MIRLLTLTAGLAGGAFISAAAAGEWYDLERWTSAGAAVASQSEGPWRVNVGAGASAAPVYLGAEEYDVKPLPLLDVDYRGLLFASTQRGFGYNFFRKRTFRAGPRITIDWGRDSADSDRLRGLPDVGVGVEAGLFAEAYTGSWRFQADVKQEIADGHGGLLASADVAYGARVSEALSLFLGASVTYMGEEYAAAYFGTPAGSPLGGFEASSGLRDVTPYAQFVYHFTPTFYAALDGRFYILMSEAADSPIVESDMPFVASFMVGYRF